MAPFFAPSPLEPRPRQPCKELHTAPRHRCCGQIGTYCWGLVLTRANGGHAPLFSLNSWGEDALIAKLQGVSSAKRAPASTVTFGCNQQIEVATNKQTLRQQNRTTAQLPAFHSPCRLSSEGSVLTSLGNFTKIIVKNAEKFGKIGRYFPDKFLQRTPFGYNYERKFHWQNIR